jgi:RNA polymerase sporulation-specific sigma factor
VSEALDQAVFDRAMQGDKEARDQWVRENMALVYAMARRIPVPEGDKEDIIQAGCVGLTQALNHFDPQRGVRFSTYAVPMILGEMREQARRSGLIRTGRQVRSQSAQIMKTHDELCQKLGRQPTLREIAEASGISAEEIALNMDALAPVTSMDESDGEDRPALQVPDRHNVEEEAINEITAQEILGRLNERQKKLLILRYFEDQTQSEISRLLGISQVQVSRIEKKLLLSLRSQLKTGEGSFSQDVNA